jgi:hypothetical protein
MPVRSAFLALLLLGACGRQPDADGSASTLAAPLGAADSARAEQQGAAVAGAIAQGLAQRLHAEMERAGAAGAVDFCAREALVLTDSLLDQTEATAVRRTSTRIRNPRNAPDALERVALAWFDSVHAATGELPPSYVQAAGEDEVRYYRPLTIAPFCTSCHGTADAIDPDVRRILAERYPDDRATGYEAGDLRGVIRVSLPRGSPR